MWRKSLWRCCAWLLWVVSAPSIAAMQNIAATPSSNLNRHTSVSVTVNHLPHDPAQRPSIGLVLAGGGAKGAAHIGVLKALEEMRVPIDYIAGTSMGAYVGGLYATGMSATEIEQLIDSIDWNSGYRDRVNRSQRKVRDKEYDDRYQMHTDLGLRWGEIRASKGVVQGQNMLRILRQTSGNLPAFTSFDQLAIPYRSVATDIVHLQQVILDHGYLVDAMMASMSVPGALPPYEINGKLLVDGGVTNNMPIDVAKAMGADIVIAVDISSDYQDKDSFTNFLAIADQLSNYLVRRSTQDQIKNLDKQDIYLKPNIGQIETTQFDKMPEAYAAGYEVALDAHQSLQRLSVSKAEYAAYQQRKQKIRAKLHFGNTITVKHVNIINQSHYSDAVLASHLGLEDGKVFSADELEAKAQELYALERFELVTYRYTPQKDGTTNLDVIVKEKSWGPNYLNFRFSLEDDFKTPSQYSLGASANFTDLNDTGAELRTNIEMGTTKRLELELYTPFVNNQQLFSYSSLKYSDDTRNILVTDSETSHADPNSEYVSLNYSQWDAEVSLGYQPRLWQEFSTGLRYSDGQIKLSNLFNSDTGQFTRKGAFIRYRFDSLDDFDFPTQGWYFDSEYLFSQDSVKNEDDTVNDNVSEFEVNFTGALTSKRNTLVFKVNYGVVTDAQKNASGDAPSLVLAPRELGGFLNLSGLPRNSLLGDNKVFSSLVYRYRWFDNDFGLFQSPVYLGASVEYGGVWTDTSIGEAPMYVAGSLFTGVDSPIGPIILAYGQTENNFRSVYLILGTSYK